MCHRYVPALLDVIFEMLYVTVRMAPKGLKMWDGLFNAKHRQLINQLFKTLINVH